MTGVALNRNDDSGKDRKNGKRAGDSSAKRDHADRKDRDDAPITPGGMSERDFEALDRAWEDYEAGEIERAAEAVGHLFRRTDGHPEVRFLRGVLLLESDEPKEALAELNECVSDVEDQALHAYYRSLALYDLARFEEAEGELQILASTDLDTGSVQYLLAQVRENLGRREEADRAYASAHAAAPEDFPLPMRMSRSAFEEAIHDARGQLPENLQEKLDQVPVVVDDLPPREILTHPEGEGLTPDLLGLFVGRNLRDESVFEIPGIPAAIYIYERNLERACRTREELVSEIATTLYHELGHYLGLDEDDLRELGVD